MGSGLSHSQLGAVRIPDGVPSGSGHQQPDRARCGPIAGQAVAARGLPAPSASAGDARGCRAGRPSLHCAPFCGRCGTRLSGRPQPRGTPARQPDPGICRGRAFSSHPTHRVTPAQHLLLGLIGAYRKLWIPAQVALLGPAPACRFTPTCSAYAGEALRIHGAWSGTLLSARRVCRCHPWGGAGFDPVPPVNSPSPHSAVTLPSS